MSESNPYTINSLLEIMKKLRAPQGCPWDQEQTHASLTRYLLEETYEVIEAIEEDNPEALTDELGDLLLQVVFHAQIGWEQDTFSMEDIINGVCTKLIRRHPHVFADTEVESVGDVLRNWEAIKKEETRTKDRVSLLDGIPPHLPALLKAEKVQNKTAKVGFEWDTITGAFTKLTEEMAELHQAIASKSQEEIDEELGDVLFCLVNIARYLSVNPELALNRTTNKFISRFKFMEELAQKQNLDFSSMTLAEMDHLWEQAKIHLRKKPQ